MLYVPGKLLLSLRLLLLSLALLAVVSVPASPVLAATAAGATTTITAVILPVRYILLNKQGEIITIISNTTTDVTPKVYMASFQSPELPLTPALNKQYLQLMSGLQTTRFGTIYSRPTNQAARATYLSRLSSYISYDRTPLKKLQL